MRIRLATLLFVAALGSQTAAQVAITGASRSYSIVATGYDYEFDDGAGAADSTSATAGVWDRQAFVDLDDYYGIDVATGFVRHASALTPGAIRASLEVEAASDGALHYSDSWCATAVAATIEVPVRARYRMSTTMTTTDSGYAVAIVQLQGNGQSRFFERLFDGRAGTFASSGWLAPGTWTLGADAEAVVIENRGEGAMSRTTLELDFRLFDTADFDTSGTVDGTDLAGFLLGQRLLAPEADVDGDGDVSLRDRWIFLRAWRAATRPTG